MKDSARVGARGSEVVLIAGPGHGEDLAGFLAGHGLSAIRNGWEAPLECFALWRVTAAVVIQGQESLDRCLAIPGHLRRIKPGIVCILLPAVSAESTAIAALRAGFHDYLKPPVDPEDLRAAVASFRSPEATGPETPCAMVGSSAAMRATRRQLEQIGASNLVTLVTGETGTGKELAAETLHRASPRRGKPFVCINCAALPEALLESELFGHERGAFTGADARYEGKLKLADGGTVFFDEIGDLTPQGQAKLLRVIECKQAQRLGSRDSVTLDIRIVAATNRDLETMVTTGDFRKDLFYRLNVYRVHLPPLRERPEDVLPLAGHFLDRVTGGSRLRIGADLAELLVNYSWPGNVRELRNTMETLAVFAQGTELTCEDLSPDLEARLSAFSREGGNERARLVSALMATNWNVSHTAEQLHWSRMTVYRKMARYEITPNRVLAVTRRA